MTLRELVLLFKYKIDPASEAEVNQSIINIGTMAKKMLDDVEPSANSIASLVNDALNDVQSSMENFGTAIKTALQEAQSSAEEAGNSAKKSFKRAATAAESTADKIKKLFKTIGLSVSVLGVANFIKDSVTIASEAEEMQNKFDVVFQGMNDTVEEWAQTYADTINRNVNDIKTYLADAQNLLVGFMGTENRAAAAEMAENMTTLALDLASFANIDEGTAIQAMQKAVMGETESAKTLGAVLNEVTRAQAMETLGLKGKYDALDQTTKMMVNYQAILEQSPDAIGDCERSVNSYRSTLIGFQSKLKEIKTLVGQFFMPTFQKVLKFGTQGLVQIRDWIQKVSDIADKLGGADRVLTILGATAAAVFAIMNFSKIVSGLSSVANLIGKINLKAAALVAVVLLIVLAIDDFLAFMRGDNSVIGVIFEKAGIDADAARQKIIDAWDKVKSFLMTTWNGIKTICATIWGDIKNFFVKHGDDVKSILSTAWSIISNILVTAWNLIKTAANLAWSAVQIAGKGISTIITGAANVFGVLANAVSSVVSFFKEHEDAAILLGVAIGTLTALVIAYNASSIASAIASGAETAAIMALIAQDYLAAAAKGVLTAATTAWTAVTTVATTVASAFGAAIAFLTSPIGLVILAIGALIAIVILCIKHWDDIKAAAAAAWEWIQAAWANAGEWFNSNVVQPIVNFFTGLWESITTTVGNIKTSIVEGLTAAIDWIKALPAQAVQWGQDIIMGIVNGIKGAIGAVGEVVSGVASKIKSFLGFSEPEEGPLSDFHTYMPDMIDLMSTGIESGRPRIKSALNSLSGVMSTATKANAVSAGTANMAVGTSNTRSITQNVNIRNTFNGDVAGQQKSAEAMDQASTDATAEMARALQYT